MELKEKILRMIKHMQSMHEVAGIENSNLEATIHGFNVNELCSEELIDFLEELGAKPELEHNRTNFGYFSVLEVHACDSEGKTVGKLKLFS